MPQRSPARSSSPERQVPNRRNRLSPAERPVRTGAFRAGCMAIAWGFAAVGAAGEIEDAKKCSWDPEGLTDSTSCGAWALVNNGDFFDTYKRTCCDTRCGQRCCKTAQVTSTSECGSSVGAQLDPPNIETEISCSNTFQARWSIPICGDPETRGPDIECRTTCRTEVYRDWGWEYNPPEMTGGACLDSWEVSSEEVLVHLDADVLLWVDGTFAPLGSEIRFAELPGPDHTLVWEFLDEQAACASAITSVSVVPAFHLEPIATDHLPAPTAWVRFTNASSLEASVDVSAQPIVGGVAATVWNNAATVPPGGHHDVIVQFSGSGWAPGQTLPVELVAFTLDATSPHWLARATIETSAHPLGDLDLDGHVDGADLGLLLAEWGNIMSVANLDGAGAVDGGDIGILLAAWAPGTDGSP